MSSGQEKSRRRRFLTWAGGACLALSAIALLVIFVLPSPVARYVIEDQLEQLGIEHQGIDTIKIDLWDSEVKAGPIAFKAQDAREGEITEAGFRYSFGQLFETRAFIKVFFVRGVDLEVKRHDDGTITFNGVELEQLFAGMEKSAAEKAEADEAGGFGAGIDRFEFTDSKLVFEDYTGGTLTLELERLELADFFTWAPQDPGTFELVGTVNGIAVEWTGEARPFAEPKTVTVNSRIREATIERAAQFTGPTGLARQDGTIETDVRYDYVIHASGLVEGSMDGTYVANQVDIGTEAGGSVGFDTASMHINFSQTIEPDSSMALSGAFSLKTTPVSMTAASGGKLELGEIELAIEELHFTKSAETRDAGSGLAAIGLESEPNEATQTVIELLVSAVREIVRNALQHQLELDGKPSVGVKGGSFELPTEDGGAAMKLTFDSLNANFGTVDSRTLDAGWSATAGLGVSLDGFEASSDAAGARIPSIEVSSQSIEIKRQGLETAIQFDLATKLDSIATQIETVADIGLNSLEFATTGMTIAGQDGSGQLSGPIALALEGLEGTVTSGDGELALQGGAVRLDLPEFGLAGEQELTAQLKGGIKAENWQFDGTGEMPLSVGLESVALDLEEIRVSPVSADAAIDGAFTSSVTALDVKLGQADSEITLTVREVDTKIPQLGVKVAEAPSLSASGTIGVGSLESAAPLTGSERVRATVAQTAIEIADIKVAGDDIAAAANIGTGKISVQIAEQSPQLIDIDALRVDGLQADPSQAIEIDAITLERLAVKLNETVAALGAEGGEDKPSDQQAVPIRIGEVSISPGSTIEFNDSSVTPPMNLQVMIDKAQVGPIDTGAPETKTELDLGLKTEEGATVTVNGWASPLRPTPDFDLTTAANSIPLPPFSPYAGSAVGMYIDSGSLTADAKAAANGGDLNGNIDVLVEDLYLEPLSDEDSKGFEDNFGVPVGFAVGILKNDKGQIDLGFPVSGTVEAPEIDYSEAISTAIAGAAASILPTNWFGDDGRSFEIQPVIFEPGTTEITEEGESSADQVGELLTGKPQLTIRLCGKAAAADLIVFRGGEPPAESAPEEAEVEGDQAQTQAEPKLEPIAKPTEEEVNKLLALAEERRKTVQRYLVDSHGIDKAKIFECRSSYSVESSKPPRAEFRL